MSTEQCLVVVANDLMVGMRCEWVLELLQQSRVTRTWVPGTEAPFTGIMHYREVPTAVIDVRAIFGFPTFQDAIDDLRATLEAREQDHVAWLNELRDCCLNGREFTKATDPHQCAFGKWYDALRGSEHAMSALCGGDQMLQLIVNQFDAPHRAIHGIAERALERAGSGDLDGASALIDATWNTELARMRELFAQLLEGVETNRNAVYVVVQAGDHRVTLVVDDVRSFIDIDTDQIQASSIAGEDVEGIFASDEYGEVTLLDLPHILERLSAQSPVAA